jgi:hypothetical protein
MVGVAPKKVKATVVLSKELHEMLQLRSERNLRSLSQEIVYLIETGLAQKSDQVRDTIHMIYKAQGTPYPADLVPTD